MYWAIDRLRSRYPNINKQMYHYFASKNRADAAYAVKSALKARWINRSNYSIFQKMAPLFLPSLLPALPIFPSREDGIRKLPLFGKILLRYIIRYSYLFLKYLFKSIFPQPWTVAVHVTVSGRSFNFFWCRIWGNYSTCSITSLLFNPRWHPRHYDDLLESVITSLLSCPRHLIACRFVLVSRVHRKLPLPRLNGADVLKDNHESGLGN